MLRLGRWWGQGLGFSCLTQKEPGMQRVNPFVGLSNTNKGTSLQTKVEGGGLKGEARESLVVFLPSGAFVLGEARVWDWVGGRQGCV